MKQFIDNKCHQNVSFDTTLSETKTLIKKVDSQTPCLKLTTLATNEIFSCEVSECEVERCFLSLLIAWSFFKI
jgi:hypothetical protein